MTLDSDFTHFGGNGGRATLRKIRFKGKNAVLKNYNGCSRWFRYTCGLYMAHREEKAYLRLNGIRGVPCLLGKKWPDGLVLEWIDGKNCLCFRNSDCMPLFFDCLRNILKSIRSRGVLHGDVKRNILVDLRGAPVVVDFGASFLIPWWLKPFKKRILKLGAQYDARAVLKLKRLMCEKMLTPEERAVLNRELPLERSVKRVERLIRTITVKIVSLEIRRGS